MNESTNYHKGTQINLLTQKKVEGKTENWTFSVAKFEKGAMRPKTSKL